jgi:TetR/AcrR family transcriptional repressor of bet genes
MMAVIETAVTSRKASKDVRRQQLIDATIKVLARKGYAALTVADVAKAAGLSVGIISFHFESKDGLLANCLQFLADEYYRNWKSNIAQPGATPAERLRAMLIGDFDDQIFSPEKLRAWIAFWGETQGRPIYEEICSERDLERGREIEKVCGAIIADGGYAIDAGSSMRALEAMMDGLWLDVVASGSRQPHAESAAKAREAVTTALAAFFPRHFTAS